MSKFTLLLYPSSHFPVLVSAFWIVSRLGMPPPKSVEALLKRPRENGSELNKIIVVNTKVQKRLELSAERKPNHALYLWGA